MSRVIKFRAWNPEDGDMSPSRDLDEPRQTAADTGFDAFDRQFMFEQFTDPPGQVRRHIYEGDIVTNIKAEIGIVKWLDDIAGFSIDYSPSGA